MYNPVTRMKSCHGIFFTCNSETRYKNKVATMGRKTNQNVLYFKYQRK